MIMQGTDEQAIAGERKRAGRKEQRGKGRSRARKYRAQNKELIYNMQGLDELKMRRDEKSAVY